MAAISAIPVSGCGLSQLVYCHHGQEGPNYISAGFEHNGCNRHPRLPPVRAQVAEQAPHQPAVVRFTEDFFFLVGCHWFLF
jgi:hypothetical protein